MESQDVALIEQASRQDQVLAQLWEEHLALEHQLSKLERKPYLTTEEQVERNRIKKIKLAGRDKIESILAHYRTAVQANSHAG